MKLKDCPFCGASVAIKDMHSKTHAVIACPDCQVPMVHMRHYCSLEEMVKAWNTRKGEKG